MPIIVCQKASVQLGNRVTIASSVFSNLLGLYQRTIIVSRNGAEVEIGDNVAMSGATIYSFKRIAIGENTLIGANTKIIDSDMHPVDYNVRLVNRDDKSNTIMKDVNIGKNVFIGCNCLILKGVNIGDNAVIGAGSVVVDSIPENSIAAGNPARVIRRIENQQ